MSEPRLTLAEFLRTRIAGRFEDMLGKAEQRLAQAEREFDDLRRANGTVQWEVIGDQTSRCFVNLVEGEMRVAAEPAAEPFATVVMSAADWSRFVAGSGPGGVFAADDRPFGRSRIERVRAIRGTIRVSVTALPDGSDFSATVHFGPDRPPEPNVTLELPAELALQVQSGALNPQAAFMQGEIKLSGDMGFAMQLGIAFFL